MLVQRPIAGDSVLPGWKLTESSFLALQFGEVARLKIVVSAGLKAFYHGTKQRTAELIARLSQRVGSEVSSSSMASFLSSADTSELGRGSESSDLADKAGVEFCFCDTTAVGAGHIGNSSSKVVDIRCQISGLATCKRLHEFD